MDYNTDRYIEAILDWREKILKLLEDQNNEAENILSNLIKDLRDIKDNHFFANEVTTPVRNFFFVYLMDSERRLTDSEKIQKLLEKAVDDYKECMEKYINKLKSKCKESIDLVNRILEKMRNESETHYQTIIKDFDELKENLFLSRLINLKIYLTSLLEGIITGFLNFLFFGLFFKDTFKERCQNTIDKVEDFKSEQIKQKQDSSLEIWIYFNNIINPLNDDFNLEIKKVIWFDLKVRNNENSRYETRLRNKLAPKLIDLSTFDDKSELVAFVNKLSTRTLLITSGSSYQDVFGSCYNSTSITDVIVFAYNLDLCKTIKQFYDKVYRVVNSFDSLLESIEDVLNDNTFNWMLPLNRINKRLIKFNNDYAYSNFEQIPRDIESYSDIIEKAIEMKLSNENQAREEVLKFLKVLKWSYILNDIIVARYIIYMYTCESIYYKLVNQVLKDLKEENILKCEIWIKSLNLALKIVNANKKVLTKRIKLFRTIACPGINVRETYKEHMAICFPAFTSTTTREDVSKSFRNGFNNILFEIDYDFSKRHSIPPVKISQYSRFKSEEEHLFSIFSLFYIKKIEIENDERNFKILLEN